MSQSVITRKMRLLWGTLITLFILHGIEEFMTKFYDLDPLFIGIRDYISGDPQSAFIVFQAIWWVLLLVSFWMPLGSTFKKSVLVLLGFIVVFETHHLLRTLTDRVYYPGSATVVPLLIVGFFFWRELFQSMNLRS